MPKYKKGDETSYFSSVIAILIVIAVAVATFVFSLVKNDTGNIIDDEDTSAVNPTNNLAVPDGPPLIVAPATPPPTD